MDESRIVPIKRSSFWAKVNRKFLSYIQYTQDDVSNLRMFDVQRLLDLDQIVPKSEYDEFLTWILLNRKICSYQRKRVADVYELRVYEMGDTVTVLADASPYSGQLGSIVGITTSILDVVIGEENVALEMGQGVCKLPYSLR